MDKTGNKEKFLEGLLGVLGSLAVGSVMGVGLYVIVDKVLPYLYG